jgi:hypothetical protein
MNTPVCLLCNASGAQHRPGRLGRYAQTCDCCEQRRGQLAHAGVSDTRAERTTGALQWSARPR